MGVGGGGGGLGVGFCSGFRFISQWVSVDFSVFCSGF